MVWCPSVKPHRSLPLVKLLAKIVSLRQWLVVAIALDIAIPCFGRIERKKTLKERSSPQTLKMSHLGERISRKQGELVSVIFTTHLLGQIYFLLLQNWCIELIVIAVYLLLPVGCFRSKLVNL